MPLPPLNSLHYDDVTLHSEITTRLSEHLENIAFSDAMVDITDYGKWKKAMTKDDKNWVTKHATETKEILKLAATMNKATIMFLFPHIKSPPLKMYSSGYSWTPATSSSLKPTTDDCTPIPTLMNNEHALLHDHCRCFIHRKFYASHQHKDCPDWPIRHYKPLTAANTMAAQKCFEASKKSKKVAAVSVPKATIEDANSDNDLAYTPVPVSAYTPLLHLLTSLGLPTSIRPPLILLRLKQ
ncbi:hypothetical protein C8T65DRAFT_750791 [Cerioporus squamosus]|nr:hypothetical protein C8T65DRAFT_750791 [Cerioporus squamosus]